MDSTDARRPAFATVSRLPSGTATPSRMLVTNLDDFHSNPQANIIGSPQATTPEAIRFYRQRQTSRGPSVGADNSNGGTVGLSDRLAQSERSYVRTYSGSSQNTSQEIRTPTLGPSQKASIKDLVAKFNTAGGPATAVLPTRPIPSPAGSHCGKLQDVQPGLPSEQEKLFGSRMINNPGQTAVEESSRDLRITGTNQIPPTIDDHVERAQHTNFVDIDDDEATNMPARSGRGVDIPAPRTRKGLDENIYPSTTVRTRKGSQGSVELSPVLSDAWHFNPDALRPSSAALTHKRSQSDSFGLQSNPSFKNQSRQHMSRQSEDLQGASRSRFFKPPSPQSRLPVRSSRVKSVGPGYAQSSPSLSPLTPPKGRSPRKYDISPGVTRASGQRLRAIVTTPIPQKSPPLRSSRPRQFISTATRYSAQDPFATSTHPGSRSVPRRQSKGEPFSTSGASEIKHAASSDRLARNQTAQEEATDESTLTPISTTWSFDNSPVNPRPKHMVIAHKDLANHLGMAGGGISSTDAIDTEDPTALPDVAEQAFSSNAMKRFFTPAHSRNISEQGLSFTNLKREESDIGLQEEKPNLLSQILGMRKDASPGLKRNVPSNGHEIPSMEPDSAEEIQIMLSETPELQRLSEKWHQDLIMSANARHSKGPVTPSRSIGTYTPLSGTPTKSGGQRGTRSTMDSDSYSMIYRVLEQYYESGTISPEMVTEFHQHILETDPDLSGRDDSESMHIAKVALEGLIRDHSRGSLLTNGPRETQPSPLKDYLRSKEMSGSSLARRDGEHSPSSLLAHDSSYEAEGVDNSDTDEPSQMIQGFTPMNTVLHEIFDDNIDVTQTTVGQDVSEALGPTPPPKDVSHAPPGPAYEAHRRLLQSPQSRPDSPQYQGHGRMQLPEIPSTGGGLGLAIGFDQQHSTRALAHLAPVASGLGTNRVRSSSYSAKYRPEQAISAQSTPPSEMMRYISESSSITPTRPAHDTPPSSASQNASTHRESLDDRSKPSPALSMTSEEQKRLIKRRYTIRELFDTEHSFNQDMKIVRDIYMTTAREEVISPEDSRILFGNTKDVVAFSEDFLASLRDAARSVYIKPRDNRFPRKLDGVSTSNSGQADQSPSDGFEPLDDHNDRNTFIGDVFIRHLPKMRKVYGDYTNNATSANQRLEKIKRLEPVNVWLTMCQENAQDLTKAWDLDSLLVKPTQRFLKYPLLMEQILDCTPEDHPDFGALTKVLEDVRDFSDKMNKRKERSEVLVQMLHTTEKDKPTSISKALGLRRDKVRHQVGVSNAINDPEYQKIAEKFGGQSGKIPVVQKGYELYLDTTRDFVHQWIHFIEGAEECLSVNPSAHPDLERKWRKFAFTIRELIANAWVKHVSIWYTYLTLPPLTTRQETSIRKHCIDPLEKLSKLYEGPNEMMARRKTRLVDYAKYKAIIARGEKPNSKTLTLGKEFEVLNDTLKDELPQLYALSRDLALTCLENLIELQKSWNQTWRDKILKLFSERQVPKSMSDIVEVHLSDFAYPEAQAVCLGICNGSILADTSNFLSPTSTLAGSFDDLSKRPSLGASSRKTTSLLSEQSPTFAPPDFSQQGFNFNPYPEQAGTLSDYRTLLSYPNGNSPMQSRRPRAVSSLSNREGTTLSQASASPIVPMSRTNSNKASSWRNFAQQRSSTTSSVRLSDVSAKLQRGVSSPQFPPSVPGSTHDSMALQQQFSVTYQAQVPTQPATRSSSTPNIGPYERSGAAAFSSALPMSDSRSESPERPGLDGASDLSPRILNDPSYSDSEPMIQMLPGQQYKVLFLAASLFEFNIDRQMSRAGLPYLTYVPGEIFDVIGQNGELWLARNQDDGSGAIGWIWERHFAKLMADGAQAG